MSTKSLDGFTGTDRFAVRRRLGVGGMGAVYDAYDRERGQRVAIKTILRLDASSLYRFKREFRALADVVHPNLVRLHELISADDHWFFTMELVEGRDFLAYLHEPSGSIGPDPETDPEASTRSMNPGSTTQSSVGPGSLSTFADPANLPLADRAAPGLTAEEAPTETFVSGEGSTEAEPSMAKSLGSASTAVDPARISAERSAETEAIPKPNPKPVAADWDRLRNVLRQLAEALVLLHSEGILHRDIKPSNVLVTHNGRVVLLDFGLSTDLVSTEVGPNTTDGHVVGTVTYMSPEQAAAKPLSAASDWYSVGVMLYKALCGVLPFRGRALDVLLDKQRSEPPSPATLAEGLPDDLVDLCVALLRLDPDHRPSGDRIVAGLGGSGGGSSIRSPTSRPFVGRSAELAELAAAFEETCRGKAVAALVHGRSGAGKSALSQKFLDGLAERGEAVVLAGRCFEQESVAYKALDTLIDALSRYLLRLPGVESGALMPRDIGALARVFPVLRRVDSVADAPRRASETPDPQELRRRAFAALRELLARIADRRPLVLAIDDLQWGDLDSAALLSGLLRPPDPPALLLLCGYRREDAESSVCLRSVLAPDGVPIDSRRELAVEPLTQDDARDLAIALLGQDDSAAQSVASMVAQESGGSPFFVYELVRHLREGGELTESLASSGEFSLDEVLRRRVSRLPDGQGRLLALLAIAGKPIAQASACRASGLGAAGFEALASLRREHLVRGTGSGSLDDVEIYHDRIRETIDGSLEPSLRAELHRALVKELESVGGCDPETLAIHFEAAADPIKAGRFYAEAADEASGALAFERAAKLYRRALDLSPPSGPEGRDLLARLGDALANAGRGVEAGHAYLQAAEGAETTKVLELQGKAGFQLAISGHIDEGLDTYRAVLERVGNRLPRTPRESLIRLMLNLAVIRIRGTGFRERDASRIDPEVLSGLDLSRSVAVGIGICDYIRGTVFQARNLLRALRVGEPYRVALALGWEAVQSSCHGHPARKRTARLIESANSLARRVDNPHALGMAKLGEGAARYLQGYFVEGTVKCDEAIGILRDRCTGVAWELDSAQLFCCWSLIYRGEIANLKGRYPTLMKETMERGDRYLESSLGVYPGALVHLADDDLGAARDRVEASIARWSTRSYYIQNLTAWYGHLLTDLYGGDGPTAWRRVESEWAKLDASMMLRIEHVRIDCHQLAGRSAVAAAVSSSDPSARLRDAERHARRLSREPIPRAGFLARQIRAGSASIRGDFQASAAQLRTAIEGFDSVDMNLNSACCRRQLGRLLGGDEGRALIEAADRFLTSQAIKNPSAMADCIVPGFARLG